MGNKKLATFAPGRIVLMSIFGTIIAGTLALALPIARTEWIPLLDLFFTATSATCVTGMFTVPLAKFTFFGHCIILFLIQIGGIGLITLSLFLLSLFVDLGLATTMMAVQLLDVETWKNIRKFIFSVAVVTIIAELLGACIIFLALKHSTTTGNAIFLSLFHSVSSFCNAGISPLGSIMHQYAHNYIILGTTGLLMLFGGLGFITWNELMHYVKSLFQKKRYAFSLHSKIILYVTALLLAISTVLIFALEWNHGFANVNPFAAAFYSLFHAISFKSAGFLIVPAASLRTATLMVIMIIGFIGSSPGSTGSGIKITTLALFAALLKATFTGKTAVHIRGRRIVKDQLFKAVAIVAFSGLWIMGTIFLLLLTDSNLPFLSIVFEAVSAFATLGIATGISSTLSIAGKFIMIFSMIIGRIGSLTLVLALKRARTETRDFSYPDERVMLS